jgi:hypothetical protein
VDYLSDVSNKLMKKAILNVSIKSVIFLLFLSSCKTDTNKDSVNEKQKTTDSSEVKKEKPEIVDLQEESDLKVEGKSFYKKEDGKFSREKITILEVTPSKISVQVYYESSERCACESDEIIEINKNQKGEFIHQIFDNLEKTIRINFKENRINSINVMNSEDYDCCSIISGSYFIKP